MDKGVVLSFLYLLCFQSYRCGMFEEPRCSKYDFEEKVLEKLVRLELKMETMTVSVNEISTQVKDDINKMRAHMADMTGKIQAEWTDIKETIQDDWTEIRKEFEMMKGELVDREKMLNDSIQKTLTDLSGI